jgi:hypothetical protein
MKTMINKLIQLADSLDGLGLKKDADTLDRIVAKTAAGEDFGDLMKLFDEPVVMEDSEDEGVPVSRRLTQVPEEYEVLTPITDSDEPVAERKEGPGRLDMIRRRHELMKLKQMMEHEEKEDAGEEVPADVVDVVGLPVASPEELESFEDESDEESEDDDGMFGALKDALKQAPNVLMQVVKLVENNPELLAMFL